MDKQEKLELAEMIATAVISAFESKGFIGNTKGKLNVKTKTAYQKTESLLYNYRGFKKIVAERTAEIAEIQRYGVPQRSGSIVQYGGNTGGINRTQLPEESVEAAIKHIEESMKETKRVINLIDNSMYSLRNDPYYKILEWRYFDGRTQEDIALSFNCSQVTISNNNSRLIKDLALRIFPEQTINEMLL